MSGGPHGLLCIDKPRGKTSHDVVAMLRRALGTRRVGHAGTLDPMATGLLVVAVGEGLKVIRYLMADDKHYAAEVTLGSETDTLDAEGVVVQQAAVPRGMDLETVRRAAAAFVGPLRQRAPLVSALRQGGERLHVRARRGEAVEAPERDVVVRRLEVESLSEDRITMQVWCGKGFYVRSLARDLAQALGTCGHLSALRRLASGGHRIDGAVSSECLVEAFRDEPGARERLASRLRPLPEALHAPRLVLDARGADDARHGRPVSSSRVTVGTVPAVPTEPLWLLTPDMSPLALARWDGDALHVVRGIRL